MDRARQARLQCSNIAVEDELDTALEKFDAEEYDIWLNIETNEDEDKGEAEGDSYETRREAATAGRRGGALSDFAQKSFA